MLRKAGADVLNMLSSQNQAMCSCALASHYNHDLIEEVSIVMFCLWSAKCLRLEIPCCISQLDDVSSGMPLALHSI